MMEIKGIGPGGPILPEDIERERFKEIKTRLGRAAFMTALGKNARVSKISHGISMAEGALKWMEEVFRGDRPPEQ
jgi:hypothetical protein